MKDDTLEYEKYRIIIARELRIAPDDIDLAPILQSAFRAIRENCERENCGQSDHNEYLITLRDKAEEEAILGEYGQMIINRIFEREHPFETILEDYSDWYISVYLSEN